MPKKHEPQPCWDCGGPKEKGRGRKFCDACADKRKPIFDREAYRIKQARWDGKLPPLPNRTAKDGEKWCPRCQQNLPIDSFALNKSKKNRASYCIECASAVMHEKRLARVYGMTTQEYETLLAIQGGKCAVCFRRPGKRRLAVDHSHSTGEIRGLLCSRCNHKVLGASGEDPAVLRRAALYLERPPAVTGSPVPADPVDMALEVERALEDLAERQPDDLPFVIWRPNGHGPADIGAWPVMLRLDEFTALLHDAGHGVTGGSR